MKKELITTMGVSNKKIKWLSNKNPLVRIEEIRERYLGFAYNFSDEEMIYEMTKNHIMEMIEFSDKVYFSADNVNSDITFPYLKGIKKEVKEKLGYDLEINLHVFPCDKSSSEFQRDHHKRSEKKLRKVKLYKFIHYT